MAQSISFSVNGKPVKAQTDPNRTLLEVLREDLHLTGPKCGCGEGACGACTVLVDGKLQFSCSVAMASVAGSKVMTIEGLRDGEKLHPVQQAFIDVQAFQCGYCTSGMVMATKVFLDKNPNPTDAQIKAALNSHLCRCCGYPKLIAAVHRAVELAGTWCHEDSSSNLPDRFR